MVNFIVYEDSKTLSNQYCDIVRQAMGQHDALYDTIQFFSYSPNLLSNIAKIDGYKVFILDIEVPGKSGLDLAREIRENDDTYSQIIIVTAHKELLENTFINRSLILNYVSKFDNCAGNLYSAIMQAYFNITKTKAYSFKDEGLLCSIPLNEILFFAKNSTTDTVELITMNDVYTFRKSVVKVLSELDDPRFMRTHKSCIVNIQNIRKVDFVNRIIYFKGNNKTDLFSRNYKKELMSKLINK